jgi:hypothetical protein
LVEQALCSLISELDDPEKYYPEGHAGWATDMLAILETYPPDFSKADLFGYLRFFWAQCKQSKPLSP